MTAAKQFFEKAVRENGVPERIVMDKSGAKKAAIDEINAVMAPRIHRALAKYLKTSSSRIIVRSSA